jgi:hypothetical protein
MADGSPPDEDTDDVDHGIRTRTRQGKRVPTRQRNVKSASVGALRQWSGTTGVRADLASAARSVAGDQRIAAGINPFDASRA